VNWTTVPTDDQFVRAAVGSGGTPAQRAEVETLARDLLMPEFIQHRNHGNPMDWYARLGHKFVKLAAGTKDPVRRFAIIAAEECTIYLLLEAQYVARARAHAELWPDEPFSPHDPAGAIDPATIPARARAAQALYDRMRKDLSRHMPEILPGKHVSSDHGGLDAKEMVLLEMLLLFEDNLRCALGQGYDRSNGDLTRELKAHGIPTTETPNSW
jgi:hypothetical protein